MSKQASERKNEHSGAHERTNERSRAHKRSQQCEASKYWTVRANNWTDKRVTQYLRLDSWLLRTPEHREAMNKQSIHEWEINKKEMCLWKLISRSGTIFQDRNWLDWRLTAAKAKYRRVRWVWKGLFFKEIYLFCLRHWFHTLTPKKLINIFM